MRAHEGVFAFALLLCGNAASSAPAGAFALTPMEPGFHQRLQCNRGQLEIGVARADLRTDAHAVIVTTTLSVGASQMMTRALRSADGRGNIYALGYVLAERVIKRFPKRLLLPAGPPRAGERSAYFNVSGIAIEKRYEGARAGRYVFSDYLSGRKLNTVVYVPSVGIAEARFFNLLGKGGDLVCHAARG